MSALVGIPLLLILFYLGGIYGYALFTFLALGSLYEFNRVMRHKGMQPPVVIGYLLLMAIFFVPLYPEYYLVPLLFLLVLGVVIVSVLTFPRTTWVDMAVSSFASLYLGYLFSFGLRMLNMNHSFLVILLALLLTWSSDVGGYFTGMKWGKIKLAPRLSPKKTWEGAVGATSLTVVVALASYFILGPEPGWPLYLLLGVAASLAAQFGDLLISGMKRYFGVKDAGNLIPGHGGLLYRFDSFMLVMPVVYFFFTYWG